jgi:hypothetical protein
MFALPPSRSRIFWDARQHDHWYLMKAARGGAPQVRRMMAAAEFPIPLSGPVVVYRGAFNVDPATAVRGLAWATSHDVACWFACKWIAPPGSNPIVLRATVDASDLIYWSNDRKEYEVILRRVPTIEIDQFSDHWREIADRFAEQRRVEASAQLKATR